MIRTLTLALILAFPAHAEDPPASPPAFARPVVYTACPQAGWTLEKVNGEMTNYSAVADGEPWSILCNEGTVYAWTVQWPPFTDEEVAHFVVTLSNADNFGVAPAMVSTSRLTAYGWPSKNNNGDTLTFLLLVFKDKTGVRFTATSLSLQDALISAKGVK